MLKGEEFAKDLINNLPLKGPERDWNSWDDSPRTVQEHIEQYRQHIAKPPTPQTEEQEPDFFKVGFAEFFEPFVTFSFLYNRS